MSTLICYSPPYIFIKYNLSKVKSTVNRLVFALLLNNRTEVLYWLNRFAFYLYAWLYVCYTDTAKCHKGYCYYLLDSCSDGLVAFTHQRFALVSNYKFCLFYAYFSLPKGIRSCPMPTNGELYVIYLLLATPLLQIGQNDWSKDYNGVVQMLFMS